MDRHKKAFGLYHWDTFDNETWLVGEADTLIEARQLALDMYAGRIQISGADRLDIVDKTGKVVEKYNLA